MSKKKLPGKPPSKEGEPPSKTIIRTSEFATWLRKLEDANAQVRIDKAIDEFAKGKTGKVEVCRDKVSEIKVDYGTGYRVYFTEIGRVTAILLGGGTKKGQQADIDTAVKAAREYHKPPQTKR